LTEGLASKRGAIDRARVREQSQGSLAAGLASDAREVARKESEDRSFIARWIVVGYLVALLVITGLLFARALASGHWDSAVADAFEIFKIGVLPVVTLVLGHYFGRRQRL
jgi:hypothetical protein